VTPNLVVQAPSIYRRKAGQHVVRLGHVYLLV
jgi:hypothetical protein